MTDPLARRSAPRRRGAAQSFAGGLLLAAALLGGIATMGRASFEVRIWDPAGSPHLPWSAPAPFAAPAATPAEDDSAVTMGEGWSAGALHASIFNLREARFDAVVVARDHDRVGVGAAVSRLGAPGAAEWTGAAYGRLTNRGVVVARWFAFLPEPALQREAGLDPRSACTLSFGSSRNLGQRTVLSLWIVDAFGAGAIRSFELGPELGGAVSCALGRGLRVSLARRWTGGGAVGRVEVGWNSGAGLSAGQAWGARQGGREAHVTLRTSNVDACIFSHLVRAELPATTGAILVTRQLFRGRSLEATRRPSAQRPVGVPRRWDGAEIEDVGERPAELEIEGRSIVQGEDRDSLGAWADSLEWMIEAAVGTVERAPYPIDQVRCEDLRAAAGLDSACAARLSAQLQTAGPRPRSLPGSIAPELHRSWLEAAPYLTAGSAPNRFPVEQAREPDRPWKLAWRRDFLARERERSVSADQIQLQWGRSRVQLRADWRPPARGRLASGRGAVAVAAPRAEIAWGTGGDPLLWGVGLLGRAAPLRLGRSDPAAVASPGVDVSHRPGGWRPTLAGKSRFAGGAIDLGRDVRLIGAQVADRVTAALLFAHPRWIGGLALPYAGGRWAPDLWLRCDQRDFAADLEFRHEAGPGWVRALRVARVLPVGGDGSLAWLDLTHQAGAVSVAMPAEAAGTGGARLLRSTRLTGGFRRRAGRVGLAYRDDTRIRVGSESTESRSRRFELSPDARVLDRYDLHVRVTVLSSASRTLRGSALEKTPWSWRRRLRGRVHCTCPLRQFSERRRTEWGAEAGWERAWRPGTDPFDPRAGASWFGSWLALRGPDGHLNLGLLEVFSHAGVDLAPIWSSGARARLRSGLALAGAAAGRAGRWNSTIRLLWPVMPRSLGVALVRCSVAVDLAAPARPKRQSGGTSLIREKEAPPSE